MTDKICCNCQYYGGVKGSLGHAPCELKNSMTTWNKTCESIYLIPLRLLIGTTDEPETKADRIRAMSDEELADELLEWFACFMAVEWSRDMILDLLKQEVET